MLTIRQPQWEALQARRVAEFEQAALERFARVWPDRLNKLGRAAVQGKIRRAVRKTRGYGIDQSRDINRFIDLMVVWGDDFDLEQPWAADILAWPDATGPVKVQGLQATSIEQMRGTATRRGRGG